MDSPEKRFSDLARLARRAPAEPTSELPPGLATRVLAQLRTRGTNAWQPWVVLSVRAVPVALVAAAGCLLYAWPALDALADERGLAGVMVQPTFTP